MGPRGWFPCFAILDSSLLCGNTWHEPWKFCLDTLIYPTFALMRIIWQSSIRDISPDFSESWTLLKVVAKDMADKTLSSLRSSIQFFNETNRATLNLMNHSAHLNGSQWNSLILPISKNHDTGRSIEICRCQPWAWLHLLPRKKSCTHRFLLKRMQISFWATQDNAPEIPR